MGYSKEEFINVRMSMGDYQDIPLEHRQQMQVKSIDDRLEAYKDDEVLKDLYKQYAKIKDKIKQRQYQIKDNLKTNKK